MNVYKAAHVISDVNKLAMAWATEHAGERLGTKWYDGENNPGAEREMARLRVGPANSPPDRYRGVWSCNANIGVDGEYPCGIRIHQGQARIVAETEG